VGSASKQLGDRRPEHIGVDGRKAVELRLDPGELGSGLSRIDQAGPDHLAYIFKVLGMPALGVRLLPGQQGVELVLGRCNWRGNRDPSRSEPIETRSASIESRSCLRSSMPRSTRSTPGIACRSAEIFATAPG